jgi:hypothetical protein
MIFRSRIACVTLAAVVSTAAWAQDKPKDPPPDAKPADATAQQNASQAKPGEIVVNPISTHIGAQADITKLDAKYNVVAPHVALSSQHLTMQTRMLLLRGLQAEFVFLRRTFPFSEVGLSLKANTNNILPEGVDLQREIATRGAAARPGDRGQITDVIVKDHTIVFELNGGPKKKTKWYQRIQVGGAGGMAPVAPQNDNSMAHGSLLTLDFDKFVPEMTVAQVKQLLSPVFDFSSVSATQAYADIMPPKVKAALNDHRALVGMTKDMVINAKGRPDQKIRESEAGSEFEEWVYGKPPQTVEFVRFVGDEVTQIKDMPMGGTKVVRTEREVDFPPGQVPGTPAAVIAQSGEAEGQAPGQAQKSGDQADSGGGPAPKPTLRRAGEPEIEKGQAPLPGEIKRPPGPNRTPSSDPGSDTPGTPLPGPPLPAPQGPPGAPGQQTPGIPPE